MTANILLSQQIKQTIKKNYKYNLIIFSLIIILLFIIFFLIKKNILFFNYLKNIFTDFKKLDYKIVNKIKMNFNKNVNAEYKCYMNYNTLFAVLTFPYIKDITKKKIINKIKYFYQIGYITLFNKNKVKNIDYLFLTEYVIFLVLLIKNNNNMQNFFY